MSEFLLHNEQTSQVYLDANATTPVLPCIADVVSHTMQICFGNPSSPHISGIQAKYLLEQTRQNARHVIGAPDGDILFTSGATEGIQTAIVSTLISAKNHTIKNPVLLYGATEHKAVPNTLQHWNNVLGINAQLLAIPVDSQGLLDLAFISEHIENALMICTMAVNNETGVYQNLDAIETAIRSRNKTVSWMVDCVQALGKKALSLSSTSIDYAPFSGHKLYAPKGIGFLYIKNGSAYTPFIAGGGQESGMRSGTENLPGIAGLNKLFNLLLDQNDGTFKSVEVLNSYRAQLHSALQNTFGAITFNHEFTHSVPTTLNFAVDTLTSKEVIDLFDAAGIRVSGGSACSTGATRSFVLDAMGATDWQSENAVRLSFGPAATQAQITQACERIASLKAVLEANCLIVSDSVTPNQEVCAIGLTQFRHKGACSWLYVSDDNSTVIIDPVIELIPRFEKIVSTQKLKVKAILDTHKHQERPSAVPLLNDVLDITPTTQQNIKLGAKTLITLATPGHSEDSVSYLLKEDTTGHVDYCFCGDLILPTGLGNTSLEGGSAVKMAQSLTALAEQVTDDTVVCSGHDYQQCFAIDWRTVQAHIPLLSQLLENKITTVQFAELKTHSAQQHMKSNDQLCGYVNAAIQTTTQQLDYEQAKALLKKQNVYLIDTREPYEHGTHNVADVFASSMTNTLNISLSRMANAIVQKQLNPQHTYILICRSGNRSKVAAANLQQLGFGKIYNVVGGLALLG